MNPSKAWIIGDTIEKNKRVFKIPVYQRNYDWTNVQCEKLYNDIIDAYRMQKKHFTGTIVYISGDKNSSSLTEDLIIDGQQRITTIMILIKALLDIAIQNEDSLESELSDLLFNRHCDESNKLKLKPVDTDDKQFQFLMENKTDFFNTDSHIIRNYELFKKLIRESLREGMYLGDILEGMKKLEIVEIVLDKSQGDDPQVIFESINSTGLELSLADKIRNFLLMDEEKQDELYIKYWLPLAEKIGDESLRDYFILFLGYKLPETVSKKNAYDKFKKFFRDGGYTHEKMLKELEVYAKYYAAFIGRKNNYSSEINKILSDFRIMDQSTVYVFLLHVFYDHEMGKISDQVLYRVLLFLRSYSFRRIICEHSSNTLRGLYKTLYGRLFRDNDSLKYYYETIYSFFKNTTTKDRLVSDEEFYDSLVYKNLYGKKKVCKYLLTMLENEGSHEQINTDTLTIEHILPQKENALVWKRELGKDYEYVYKKYLHTLGNLTITGYNSELGTKSFSDKKVKIREVSKAKKLNSLILSERVWDESAILNRAQSLAEEALEIFKIDEAEIITRNRGRENTPIYTLHDYSSVSGTIPSEYTFYGENVIVKSYSEMLRKMIDTLYGLEPHIIEKLANNRFYITSSDRVYITTNKKELRKGGEIGKTGIYYETNLSASYILLFIKALIEECEMDADEFEFLMNTK